jgi:hypothetical protein
MVYWGKSDSRGGGSSSHRAGRATAPELRRFLKLGIITAAITFGYLSRLEQGYFPASNEGGNGTGRLDEGAARQVTGV